MSFPQIWPPKKREKLSEICEQCPERDIRELVELCSTRGREKAFVFSLYSEKKVQEDSRNEWSGVLN